MVALARLLDLHHVGAGVAEPHRRERPGDEVLHRQHLDAREGQGIAVVHH
jgi:hypothetical protein